MCSCKHFETLESTLLTVRVNAEVSCVGGRWFYTLMTRAKVKKFIGHHHSSWLELYSALGDNLALLTTQTAVMGVHAPTAVFSTCPTNTLSLSLGPLLTEDRNGHVKAPINAQSSVTINSPTIYQSNLCMKQWICTAYTVAISVTTIFGHLSLCFELLDDSNFAHSYDDII